MSVLRDQGFNVAVGAIAGVSVLGLWSLASRLVQVPLLLFGALWRVSYPAFSRLLAAGEDARSLIERGVAVLALWTGALLSVLLASSPALVPVVFGPRWNEAINVLPGAALGLMVGAPVFVLASGYLNAVGEALTVVRSIVLDAVALGAIALPLLPVIGIAAIGFGWLAAGLVEALVLGRAVSRRTGASVFRQLAVPTAAATAAATVGWLVAVSAPPTFGSLVLSAMLAGTLYFAALVLAHRALVADAFALAGRALRGSLVAP